MTKTCYVIAGEASGDVIGAHLMRAIKRKQPNIIFYGIGGALMEAEGMQSLFPMRELSVMGLAEIAPKLFSLMKRINQTIDDIIKKQPDYLVTIDAPDFSFRVQKAVKKKQFNIKQIHYVAPTVWAWRAKRAAKVAKFLDGIICLFDFEPPYFEKEGLRSIAAGHPMMESNLIMAQPLKIGQSDAKKIGLFFGSREGEIKRHADVFVAALKLIQKQESQIEIIVPTLPHLKTYIENITQAFEIPVHIIDDKEQKDAAMKSCDMAIAVSGTVGLELAVAGVPHIIAYKMNPLTFALAKRLVKVQYAHLVNIMLDAPIVPEFIQGDCNAGDIAQQALVLLSNQKQREGQINAFDKVRQKLGAQKSPSDVAAGFILN